MRPQSHVSPLRAMTNVDPAGNHQAVAKIPLDVCPPIHKEFNFSFQPKESGTNQINCQNIILSMRAKTIENGLKGHKNNGDYAPKTTKSMSMLPENQGLIYN